MADGRFAFAFGWRLAILLVLAASMVVGTVGPPAVAAEGCVWTRITGSAFSTALFTPLPVLPGVVVPPAYEAVLGGLASSQGVSESATALTDDEGGGGAGISPACAFPQRV